jgi:hypothetical protein
VFTALFLLLAFVGEPYGRSYPVSSTEDLDSRCLLTDKTDTNTWEISGRYLFVSADGPEGFTRQLNAGAKCGYRLKSVTKLPLYASETFFETTLIAVMEFSERERFEYDWFEEFTPGETQTRLNHRAEAGYYFKTVMPLAVGICDSAELDSTERSENERVLDRVLSSLRYSYGALYFVERQTGKRERREYRVLTGIAGWGKRPTAELESELRKNLERGFQPMASTMFKIGNREAIGLIAEKSDSDPPRKSSDYALVRSEFGFEKKVNRLAVSGYQFRSDTEFNAFRHALLVKSGDKTRYRYSLLNASKKQFQRQISEASKTNMRYSGKLFRNYGCDFAEVILVFSSDRPHRGTRHEYRVLRLSDWAKTSPGTDGLKDDDSIMRQFGETLDDRFVFKDLFFADGIHAIFERVAE